MPIVIEPIKRQTGRTWPHFGQKFLKAPKAKLNSAPTVIAVGRVAPIFAPLLSHTVGRIFRRTLTHAGITMNNPFWHTPFPTLGRKFGRKWQDRKSICGGLQAGWVTESTGLRNDQATHNPKVAGSNPAPAITYRQREINLVPKNSVRASCGVLWTRVEAGVERK
jgi:hypothetical protein